MGVFLRFATLLPKILLYRLFGVGSSLFYCCHFFVFVLQV